MQKPISKMCFFSSVGHAYFKLMHMHAHQGGLVIAMEDVDKICNGQHTYEKGMACI